VFSYSTTILLPPADKQAVSSVDALVSSDRHPRLVQ
jgi:hypothetical protein